MVSSSLSNAPNAARVRVLQIVAGLDIGGRFGGAERAGVTLAQHLDKSRFDVSVCAFWGDGAPSEMEWTEKLHAEGIPVFAASMPQDRRGTSDFLRPARRIVSWCRQQPFDVIHAHHPGGALAGLMARRAGAARRVVRTAHMPVDLEWGNGPQAALMRAVFSRTIFPLRLDAEVAVSQQHADLMSRRLGARLARRSRRVIYNSIKLSLRTADAQPERLSRQKIGIVGRLSAQKGHATLIESMPSVLAALPRAQLIVAGDGELRDELVSLANRVGAAQAIVFLGQQTPAGIDALLAELAVFVMPSQWEGIATALLEAVAAGVPAVVSDVPGNREVIPDERAGWLVPAGDAGALGAAIIDALRCAEDARGRAAVAQSGLHRFDIAEAVQAYDRLYRELVGV